MRLSEMQKINRRYRRRQQWKRLKPELIEFGQMACIGLLYYVMAVVFLAAF